MSDVSNITYEADIQRQYVRVPLPAKIEVDGHIYDAKDWSVAGVCIKLDKNNKPKKILKEGKHYKANLQFNLSSFELSIPLRIEVCHSESVKDTLGLRFADMDDRQISIMQHLVGAYVSGELINVNDLIHIVGRDNISRPRNIPKLEGEQKIYQIIKQNLLWVMVLIASLFLFSFIATGVYEKAFVESAETAMVSGETVSVKSPSGGDVSYKPLHSGDFIKQGEVLLTVSSATGAVLGVDSPCDCVIRERLAIAGSIIRKGQPLISLTPVDANLFVEAVFSYEAAVNIVKGNKANLNFAGQNLSLSAIVENIHMSKGSSKIVKLRLRPEEALPISLIGYPVEVKIDKLGLFIR